MPPRASGAILMQYHDVVANYRHNDYRLFMSDNLWQPRKGHVTGLVTVAGRNRQTAALQPPHQRQPAKIRVDRLHKSGDPRQASNATQPLSEFISAQLTKLHDRGTRRRRPLSAQPVDHRLWLNEDHYAAWTMDGDLVTIETPKPGFGSSRVRLATRGELRDLLAVNRLIESVISLYPGDSLEAGTVSRHIPHHDLQQALQKALDQALCTEAKLAKTTSNDEPLRNTDKQSMKRLKKSRFRPGGSFIVYRSPSPSSEAPPFAIEQLGCLAPEAFEDRRKAERYIAKHTRRGKLPEGCRVARVLATVKARPVARSGFTLPREPEALIDLIRKEPRIIQPELHLEWLPRFVQADDGEWRPQQFKNARTVRNGLQTALLDRLRGLTTHASEAIEDLEVRNRLKIPNPYDNFAANIEEPARVAFRAQRRLPRSWQESIGLHDVGLGPDWHELRERSFFQPSTEAGHWLRAPFEFGRPHIDRLRSRLVELRIDDLANLLELFGLELEFWLIKESTTANPRWVLAHLPADRPL